MNLFKTAMGTAVGTIARKQMSNRGLIGFGLGLTALRVATKSVPAAFLVGGGLVLTAYYKKKRAVGEAGDRRVSENDLPAEFPEEQK